MAKICQFLDLLPKVFGARRMQVRNCLLPSPISGRLQLQSKKRIMFFSIFSFLVSFLYYIFYFLFHVFHIFFQTTWLFLEKIVPSFSFFLLFFHFLIFLFSSLIASFLIVVVLGKLSVLPFSDKNS